MTTQNMNVMTTKTTVPTEPESDKGISAVKMAVLATVGSASALVAVAWLGWSPRAAWSVLAGASLAVGNLLAFAIVGRALFSQDGSIRPGWALVGAFKFVLLLLAVALLLRYKVVGALPLMIGYGALPFGITISNWVTRLAQ